MLSPTIFSPGRAHNLMSHLSIFFQYFINVFFNLLYVRRILSLIVLMSASPKSEMISLPLKFSVLPYIVSCCAVYYAHCIFFHAIFPVRVCEKDVTLLKPLWRWQFCTSSFLWGRSKVWRQFLFFLLLADSSWVFVCTCSYALEISLQSYRVFFMLQLGKMIIVYFISYVFRSLFFSHFFWIFFVDSLMLGHNPVVAKRCVSACTLFSIISM